MSSMRLWGLVVLPVIMFASNAGAQEGVCPAGKIAGAATEGHCCWPGQTWDPATSFCAGKPECPTGMTQDGLTCSVARLPPPSSTGAAAQPPPTVDTSHDVPPPTPPHLPPPPQHNWTIAAIGASIFGAGYGLALYTSILPPGDLRCSNSSGIYNLIPFAGPFVRMASYPDDYVQHIGRDETISCRSAVGFLNFFEITSAVMQIGGLGMAIGGFMTKPEPPKTTGSWTIFPMAAGADAGATFRWTGY